LIIDSDFGFTLFGFGCGNGGFGSCNSSLVSFGQQLWLAALARASAFCASSRIAFLTFKFVSATESAFFSLARNTSRGARIVLASSTAAAYLAAFAGAWRGNGERITTASHRTN
jgi:hypothetical protein